MIGHDIVDNILKETSKQIDSKLQEQLNWLISRGILIVESKQPVMIQDGLTREISIQTEIELKVKDHGYIEELEGKISDLEERMRNQKEDFRKVILELGVYLEELE